jgi:hypothetical protein
MGDNGAVSGEQRREILAVQDFCARHLYTKARELNMSACSLHRGFLILRQLIVGTNVCEIADEANLYYVSLASLWIAFKVEESMQMTSKFLVGPRDFLSLVKAETWVFRALSFNMYKGGLPALQIFDKLWNMLPRIKPGDCTPPPAVPKELAALYQTPNPVMCMATFLCDAGNVYKWIEWSPSMIATVVAILIRAWLFPNTPFKWFPLTLVKHHGQAGVLVQQQHSTWTVRMLHTRGLDVVHGPKEHFVAVPVDSVFRGAQALYSICTERIRSLLDKNAADPEKKIIWMQEHQELMKQLVCPIAPPPPVASAPLPPSPPKRRKICMTPRERAKKKEAERASNESPTSVVFVTDSMVEL